MRVVPDVIRHLESLNTEMSAELAWLETEAELVRCIPWAERRALIRSLALKPLNVQRRIIETPSSPTFSSIAEFRSALEDRFATEVSNVFPIVRNRLTIEVRISLGTALDDVRKGSTRSTIAC